MEIKVVKRFNDTTQITVTAQGDTLMDLMFQVEPVINAPDKCGKCSSEEVTVRTRSVKEGKFQYLSYECKTCGARRPLGSYQTPKGCFFLKPWEDKYTGEET